jgi:hypothetical protein
MDSPNDNKFINHVEGIIKLEENLCSDEYDLLFRANFVPNEFDNKIINVIGEAGFDYEFEKDTFVFDYYPDEDMVIYKNNYYRITVVTKELFDKYKNNIIYRRQTDILASSIEVKNDYDYSLPWIRYPRTKDGVLIPVLVEKIFNHIPSKIVFVSEKK